MEIIERAARALLLSGPYFYTGKHPLVYRWGDRLEGKAGLKEWRTNAIANSSACLQVKDCY